jgi:hypothetical protein
LRLVEMAESAKDQTGFDAGGLDALLGGAIDDCDYCFRRETIQKMQQRGEADFGIEDIVAAELLEEVFGDDAECIFSLHELEAAGGAG